MMYSVQTVDSDATGEVNRTSHHEPCRHVAYCPETVGEDKGDLSCRAARWVTGRLDPGGRDRDPMNHGGWN